MKTSLFSPILILLILTLFAKASVLFGRIQEQTSYSQDSASMSMIVDTAYAKSTATKPAMPASTESLAADLNRPQADPALKEEKPATAPVTKKEHVNDLSKSEIELLKELSKRREKLDGEKKDIDMREQVLKATETKIDQKVVELQHLQAELEELMKQYNQKENAKILSLVKIYENMKPKDAAKIFNDLEMPVLLKVVSNMKEVKVAPIIASMDAVKARELSIELASQKPLK